jgi:hypothetical protein
VIRLQMSHHVRQLARSELAASTSSVTELGEADAVSLAHVANPTSLNSGESAALVLQAERAA